MSVELYFVLDPNSATRIDGTGNSATEVIGVMQPPLAVTCVPNEVFPPAEPPSPSVTTDAETAAPPEPPAPMVTDTDDERELA